MFNLLIKICGLLQPRGPLFKHMRVDHGGGSHPAWPSNSESYGWSWPRFQKVRCKGSGESYGKLAALLTPALHRLFHGSLHHGGVEVVSSLGPCLCDPSQRFLLGKHHCQANCPIPWCNAESLIDAAKIRHLALGQQCEPIPSRPCRSRIQQVHGRRSQDLSTRNLSASSAESSLPYNRPTTMPAPFSSR